MYTGREVRIFSCSGNSPTDWQWRVKNLLLELSIFNSGFSWYTPRLIEILYQGDGNRTFAHARRNSWSHAFTARWKDESLWISIGTTVLRQEKCLIFTQERNMKFLNLFVYFIFLLHIQDICMEGGGGGRYSNILVVINSWALTVQHSRRRSE